MRIAVVGSGPAAFGVLAGLKSRSGDIRLSLFDPGELLDDPDPGADIRTLYTGLRRRYGLKFPPPKTHGLVLPDKEVVDDEPRIWRAAHFGGLSNFWGAVALPFKDTDFEPWPIDAATMAPHYRAIADEAGLSGGPGPLADHFGGLYVNRPAIPLSDGFKRLAEALNNSGSHVAGVASLALETRPDNAAHCISCGRCMTGCPQKAIFSTGDRIREMIRTFQAAEVIRTKVRQVDLGSRMLDAGAERYGPFDHVFIAAGTLGSTEIAMRSLGARSGPLLTDNTVVTFPVLRFGRPKSDTADAHIAMTQLIAMQNVPFQPSTTKIQLYASFDHLWRSFLPSQVWPVSEPLLRHLRDRLIWARLYLEGEKSDAYAIEILEDGVRLQQVRQADTSHVSRIIDAFSSAIAPAKSRVLPGIRIRHKTSSHYTGTIPYGGRLPGTEDGDVLGRTGEIAAGVHLCDGAVFPSAPSNSPTFTIMANARRTASEVLDA